MGGRAGARFADGRDAAIGQTRLARDRGRPGAGQLLAFAGNVLALDDDLRCGRSVGVAV